MKDNLNRKSDDESNKMLSNPSLVFKKTIQTLKKKYGYSSKQIVSDHIIPHNFEKLSADIALFSKDDIQNPKIIGEVKIGNFVLPYVEYQLEEYLKTSNAKYAFLTNGEEWINYQLVKGKLIQIGDIPTAKELEQSDKEKIFVTKPTSSKHLDYRLAKFSQSLWSVGVNFHDSYLQLLTFKLYDEVNENGKYFKQILNDPINQSIILKDLWEKIDKEFPQMFSTNYFEKISDSDLNSVVLELANLSLIESNQFTLSQFILKQYFNSRTKSSVGNGISFELIKFIYDLLHISENDRLVIPYSGPETLVHTLGIHYSKYSKKTKTKDPKIITIEPDFDKFQFLNIISLLELPKFHAFNEDPVKSQILKEFRNTDLVISIPPFGKKITKDFDDLGNYGTEEINYYLQRLISTFDVGTKIAVVVPQKFLFAESIYTKNIRKKIFENSSIKAIIQLPSTVFQPYSGIQTSLIIFEIGISGKKSSQVFMSILPKSESSKEKFSEEISEEILKQYDLFSQKSIVKNPSQNAFTISSSELLENTWTVADKIPEIKELQDVSFKTRLADATESIFQGVSVMGETGKHGKNIPLIRISDLENGLIKTKVGKTVTIDTDRLAKFQRGIIQKGDVLLSCRGTLGKLAIVNATNEGALASSQIIIIRSNDKILPEYLVRILNSDFVQKQISSLSKGISQQYFTINELKNIIISVPPIKQQKDIVSDFLKLEKEIAELEHILTKKRHDLGELVKK